MFELGTFTAQENPGVLASSPFPNAAMKNPVKSWPLIDTPHFTPVEFDEVRPNWIWDEGTGPNRYLHFRRVFDLEGYCAKGLLRITADGRYVCWVNGNRVGQGPVPYRPPHFFLDAYDVSAHLRPGRNCIAVLVHSYGIHTHTSASDGAGLLAELTLDRGGRIVSDSTWKTAPAKAWMHRNRRRTWATGWSEDCDARKESQGWATPAFNDARWISASSRTIDPQSRLYPRPTPDLSRSFLPVGALFDCVRVSASPRPGKGSASLTAWLDKEPAQPAPAQTMRAIKTALEQSKPLRLPASPDHGIALTFDLGEEWSGEIEFEVKAPAGVVIQGVGAERLIDGRATAAFKGADYAFTYTTREGRQNWTQFTYNALRYLHIVVRGTDAPIVFHRLGLVRRHSALPLGTSFRCDRPIWNRLYKVSTHTLEISTQEVQVDCPTREQAPYFGDAVWTGLWTAWLTGDSSHLRHLLWLGRTCQLENGLLYGTPLTGLGHAHMMWDYSLIYIWGVRMLHDYSGDVEELRASLPTVERILAYFLNLTNRDGLLALDAAEAQARGEGVLFIDHNGLGWHIQSEPGIDRSGFNAALHLFLLNGYETYLHLAKAAGHTPAIAVTPQTVRDLRKKIGTTFWDQKAKLFADSLRPDGLSPSISEQTNALAVLFRVVPPNRGRKILERVLALKDRPVARCTPYFMIYLGEAMLACGMRAEAVELTAKRWKPMLDAGATTWWECFAGDHLDSFCHPWSALPLWMALRGILGIRPLAPAWKRVEVNPFTQGFGAASGKVITPHGELTVAWKKGTNPRITAPKGVKLEAL